MNGTLTETDDLNQELSVNNQLGSCAASLAFLLDIVPKVRIDKYCRNQ